MTRANHLQCTEIVPFQSSRGFLLLTALAFYTSPPSRYRINRPLHRLLVNLSIQYSRALALSFTQSIPMVLAEMSLALNNYE